MKPLELTKKHKFNLLEMCKKLFPEYPFIFFKENMDTGDTSFLGFFNKESEEYWVNEAKEYEEKFEWSDIDEDECDVTIHWYEFCMIHLTDKLFKPNIVFGGDYRKHCFRISEEHPIDLLYKEFKKIYNVTN